MRRGLSILALLLGLTCSALISRAQQEVSDFINPASYFQVDLSDFCEVSFKWTLKGKGQAFMNEGINELLDGKIPTAKANFEEVLKLDSLFWPAKYYHAICYKLDGDHTRSSQILEALSLREKKVPEIFLELGELYQAKGDLKKAKACYTNTIDINPEFTKGFLALGALAVASGENNKANNYFKKCIEVNPRVPEAYHAMALLKFKERKRKDEDFIKLFSQALEVDSTFRPALFWRGLVRANAKKYEACLKDWNRLILYSPQDAFLRIMRGYLYVLLNRYSDAFSDFRAALIQRREKASKYLTGQTQLDTRIDLQNALDYLSRRGYGLRSESFDLIKQGFCQIIVRQNQPALISLNKALAIEKSGAGHYIKAIVFDQMQRPDSSFSNYQKALALDNDIFDAHKKSALYYYGLYDWKSTYKEFNEMKRIDPGADVTFRISGLLKSQFKDYYGCIIDLAQVLKKDTTDLEVWKARAYCRSMIKDHKGALEDMQHWIAGNSNNEESLLLFYQIQLSAGDSTAAMNTLQKVSEMRPRDCGLQLNLSDLHIQLQSYEQGINFANKVIKNLYSRECESQNMMGFEYRAHALYNSGLASLKLQRPEDALEKWNESLQFKQPEDRLFQRFLLLVKLNRLEEAKRDLRKLRESSYQPASPYYSRYLN